MTDKLKLLNALSLNENGFDFDAKTAEILAAFEKLEPTDNNPAYARIAKVSSIKKKELKAFDILHTFDFYGQRLMVIINDDEPKIFVTTADPYFKFCGFKEEKDRHPLLAGLDLDIRIINGQSYYQIVNTWSHHVSGANHNLLIPLLVTSLRELGVPIYTDTVHNRTRFIGGKYETSIPISEELMEAFSYRFPADVGNELQVEITDQGLLLTPVTPRSYLNMK
ncbi:hypothetical protein EAN04_24485 [Salmonella enterica]|nr:hypothetical protein [Salmonella enterica]